MSRKSVLNDSPRAARGIPLRLRGAQANVWTMPAVQTPGEIVAGDVATVSQEGYSGSIRHTARAMVELHYRSPLPLELAGVPFDSRNVWPEPHDEAPEKDAVEDALHAAVCYRRGYHGLHLTLTQAQAAIATDWTRTPVGLPPPHVGSYDE